MKPFVLSAGLVLTAGVIATAASPEHSRTDASGVPSGLPRPSSRPAAQPGDNDEPAKPVGPTVEAACPGLASGALTFARLAGLPDGTLVRSGEVRVSLADLTEDTETAPEDVKAQLARQSFYVAERLAERRLLLVEARAARAKDQRAASDGALIDALLQPVAEKVTVDEAEARDFYERHPEIFEGAPLEEVRPYVESFLRREKQEAAIRAYVRALGKRMTIEVSAPWAKAQAKAARENPLDEARFNGKRPTLAALGCAPCACRPDPSEPLMAALAERLKGKAQVVHLDGRREFILADRYGVQSFPTFLVFDAQGKEVARRNGAMSEDDLVALIPDAR